MQRGGASFARYEPSIILTNHQPFWTLRNRYHPKPAAEFTPLEPLYQFWDIDLQVPDSCGQHGTTGEDETCQTLRALGQHNTTIPNPQSGGKFRPETWGNGLFKQNAEKELVPRFVERLVESWKVRVFRGYECCKTCCTNENEISGWTIISQASSAPKFRANPGDPRSESLASTITASSVEHRLLLPHDSATLPPIDLEVTIKLVKEHEGLQRYKLKRVVTGQIWI